MAHEVEQHLYKAADHMRDRGWTQGTYMDEAGRVCLMGALFLYSKHDKGVCECSHCSASTAWAANIASTLTEHVTREHYGASVACANDTIITSQDEAIAVLEKAAARAAEKGI